MGRKIKALPLFALLFTAVLGFSQGDGTTSGQIGGQTTTSTSGANATVNNYGTSGGNGGMQVQALPGPSANPGPFPMYIDNDVWKPYFNDMFGDTEVETMEMGRGKHYDIKSKLLVKKNHLPSENNHPIHLLNWSPFTAKHKDDRPIGVVDVRGKPFDPPEETVLAALYKAKKDFHTSRCLAFMRDLNVGITKGFSIGTGGADGLITGPGKNNNSTAFALGGVLGTNKVYRGDFYEVRLLCLNDGPPEAPQPPEKDKPTEQPHEEAQPAPTPAPAPPTPPEPAPAPTPEPEHKEEIPAPVIVPAPEPARAPTDCASATDLPEGTIYFPYDYPRQDDVVKLKDGDRVILKAWAQWLDDHPNCMVQVEGHASIEGTETYNFGLGDRRAKPVYEELRKYCSDSARDRVFQHSSLGKDFPKGKSRADNRRVIIRIIGPASGK